MQKLMSNTFSSLKYRNFRLFMLGQFVSLIGNWMQVIALSWTAYEITQSATSLGIIAFLSYAPLLIFGIFGGVFVDKYSKYKTLFWSQSLYSIAPLIVAYYFFIGDINIYILYFCAAVSGFLRIIDNPVRQTFRLSLIPVEETKNAISLFSASHNFAKILGPMIAGVLLSGLGAGWCFLLNAVSFWFVLITLVLMRKSEFLKRGDRKKREDVTLFHSLKYVWNNKVVRNTLIVSTLFGMLLSNMSTILPILIKQVLQGDVILFASMMSTFSAGAVLGGLYAATDKTFSPKKILNLATILCLLYLPITFLNLEFIFAINIFIIGLFTSQLNTTMNSLIVIESHDKYLGLVSSLWTISMMGMGAIGGVILGYGSEWLGIQYIVSGSSILILLYLHFYYRKIKKIM